MLISPFNSIERIPSPIAFIAKVDGNALSFNSIERILSRTLITLAFTTTHFQFHWTDSVMLRGRRDPVLPPSFNSIERIQWRLGCSLVGRRVAFQFHWTDSQVQQVQRSHSKTKPFNSIERILASTAFVPPPAFSNTFNSIERIHNGVYGRVSLPGQQDSFNSIERIPWTSQPSRGARRGTLSIPLNGFMRLARGAGGLTP